MTPRATPDPCFFCSADLAVAGSAREHVLPQWLLRHYDVENVMVEPSWTAAAMGRYEISVPTR
jgi:hypothetical protein